jgi:plastocyanin
MARSVWLTFGHLATLCAPLPAIDVYREEGISMTRMLIVAALAVFSSAAAAQSVPVTLTEWKLDMKRDTVPAGPVTFRVTNDGSMLHAFHVEGTGVDKETRQISKGESASLTLNLKPGTYELYCPMSELSHKKAGMVRKLTVVAAAAAAPKKP